MCELQRRSESLTRSLLEGTGGKGREGTNLIAGSSLFFHSAVRLLGSATKVSGPKTDEAATVKSVDKLRLLQEEEEGRSIWF
jgi:hypothetical protein